MFNNIKHRHSRVGGNLFTKCTKLIFKQKFVFFNLDSRLRGNDGVVLFFRRH